MVDEDGEAGFVNEGPFLIDEPVIDEVQVIQRHDAGEKRQNPRKTDDVEVNVDLLEELVQIMHFIVQVLLDPGNVRVALLKL